MGEVCQEFKSGNSLKADQIDTAGDYPVYVGNGLRGYTSDYNHDGEFALIGRQGALCGNMNYWVIEKKILPYFKDLVMRDITPRDVLAWQNEIT